MYSTRIMRIIVVMAVLSGVLWSAEQAQSEATQWPGPPKTQAPQDKPKTETRPAAKHDKIHPDVLSKLEKSEDGKVYVLVTLKPLPKEGLTKEQRKALAEEKQDKLLAKLAEGEFKVDYRFEEPALLLGHLSVGGLARLAKLPAVKHVEVSKIDSRVIAELKQNPDARPLVMVRLKDSGGGGKPLSEQKELVRKLQKRVLDRLLPNEADVAWEFSYIELFAARASARSLATLATDRNVKYIYLNETHHSERMQAPKTTPIRGAETPRAQGQRKPALNNSVPFLDADLLHDAGYTGKDVTVAVLDSGVDCDAPWLFIDCVAPTGIIGFQSVDPSDDPPPYGPHGTIVAAIIAGVSLPYVGVAPDASIMPVKIMRDGYWTVGDVIAGIEYVIEQKASHPNLRVMNLSIGADHPFNACSCDTTANPPNWLADLATALGKARNDAKILPFAASGNEKRCAEVDAPACISHVEPVAAVYDTWYPLILNYPDCQDVHPGTGQLCCFGNRFASLLDCDMLAAPGAWIEVGDGSLNGYWGTSFATPHASGVAALMIQKAGCPGPTPMPGIIAGLMYAAGAAPPAGDPCVGLAVIPTSINALDAVNAVDTLCTLFGQPACTGFGPGLIDLIIIIRCLRGPAVPFASGLCTCLDFPSSPPDGDVDLHDFAQFQLAFSGTAQGACCDLNVTCTDGLEEDCTGSYLGDFTRCEDIQCDPIGACCQADGSCSLMTCEDCIGCGCPPNECPCACAGFGPAGGAYQGDGFDCIPNPCTQPDAGACCQQDGTCDDGMLEADCLAGNGMYQGDFMPLCIDVTCDQPQWPTGACCLSDGTCVDDETEANCWITGLYYQGDGSTCAVDACGPSGACCMSDGSCVEDLNDEECATAGGTYEGDATVCSPNPCVQPAAACCDSIGGCLGDMTPAACTTAGGNYQGGGTMCSAYDCSTFGACCLPDESCSPMTASACAFAGGLYAGNGTPCTGIGAPDCSVDDDGGTQFGACQATEDKLLFDVNGATNDEFGTAVALSGGLVVVGAPGDASPGPSAGSAHLFRLGAANCEIEQFRLTGSDTNGGDQFGFAVALRGNTAVVGAPGTYNEELDNTGSAYVFEQPPLGWQDMFENAILNKSLLHSKPSFAKSVAIREDRSVVLVGSPSECLPGFEAECECDPNLDFFGCGAVFVFLKPLFGWEDKTEDSIINADDGEFADYFGASVSISGTAGLVGAPWEDEACGGGTNCDAGAAYVFRSNATGYNWIQEAKLTASDAESGDKFGTSVSISGNVAIVGSPFDNGAVGSAYVFRFDPQSGQWNQEAKLTASDGAADDEFGFSVSISGDLAVIGAHYEEDTASSSGSMYVFRFDGFDWNEEAKLTAWDASSGDNFGSSVSVDGDRAVAGAIWGQGGASNSGAAYVFDGLGDCNKSQTTDLCDIINDPSLDCCPPHDCCESSPDPGCSDADIETCVCKIDSTCCTAEWDAECVALVESIPCGTCDPGGNGIIDTCEYCPPDFNGDGDVEAFDLALLLGAWGPCPGGCQEDLNFDCEVDAADLAILLGCWGTCPCSAQAQWSGGPDKLGALRFALGGGNGCLSLEEAVQMMGHDDVGAFIEWVLSEVPPDWVYRVAQFLLWLLDNWPC